MWRNFAPEPHPFPDLDAQAAWGGGVGWPGSLEEVSCTKGHSEGYPRSCEHWEELDQEPDSS